MNAEHRVVSFAAFCVMASRTDLSDDDPRLADLYRAIPTTSPEHVYALALRTLRSVS